MEHYGLRLLAYLRYNLLCRPTRYDYMKHYLIDSENVGDFWIPLLELPADQAELIVFYTKNSPHMSYDSLIRLKESDRTVTFIKCYEGTNALDFQLCSELGFLIACNKEDDFIIVTNDTGYDAAVKYWRHKEYSVKRIAGKDSRTGGRRRGTPVRFDVAAEVSAILHKLARMPEEEEEEIVSDLPEEEITSDPAADEHAFDMQDTDCDAAEPEYGEEEDTEAESVNEDGSDWDMQDESGHVQPASEEEPSEPVSPEAEGDEEESAAFEDDETEDAYEEEGSFGGESSEEDTDALPAEPSEAVTAQQETDAPEEEEAEALIAEAIAEAPSLEEEEDAQAEPAPGEQDAFVPDPEEITAIVNCIGMENLAELHNQLIQFYGDNGKDIYQSLKSGSLTIDNKDWDKEEKFLYYCALILRHSDESAEALTEESITEFAQFLLGAENKRKNLNSLRYALLKHYGKEKGRRYYFMLKPYVKALNQM